ncbi:hypothetical protein [Companilactobacillus kimchiensis]|uniref:Uncharacterized protein n=1 Tax=Companilactobacillus kimchiensis TaxID=993692 RepID=A0A0R2LA32_9LACO|nr:hypothetical protein [Companilactobacillus kimchiensis]KRN98767.1 hypothetical protein IV57_GL000803 [Companilactobacillus kimchiensis]
MFFIFLAAFFIASEILVQKGFVPKFLKKVSAGKLIFYSLMIILSTAIISFLFKPAVILVVLSTIYLSIVISNFYLDAFHKMERGKKI